MTGYILNPHILDYVNNHRYDYKPKKDSIRKGDGVYVGTIGELIALRYLNLTEENWAKDVNYDIIDNSGITWDVKTKDRNGPPKENYNATVCAKNITQNCHRYLFVSVEFAKYGNDRVAINAYVLGWMPKDEFLSKSIFNKIGEVDTSSPKHKIFKYTEDCYNIPISQLYKLEDLQNL